MYKFGFERLEVWKDARSFSVTIYTLTKGFPTDEKYGLVSQLRRAVVSVSSNIAEGASRSTARDQAYFYNMAYSSLMEVLSQVLLSIEFGYISNEREPDLRDEVSKIANKVNSLRNSCIRKNNDNR